MRKEFKFIILAAAMFSLAACSDDDNNGPDESGVPQIEIEAPEAVNYVPVGTTATFSVKASNVSQTKVTAPLGWIASYSNGKLSVTAPSVQTSACEQTGEVKIEVLPVTETPVTASIMVSMCKMRVLTFEDADCKFDAYELDYCNATIAKWSDLIDSPQYGGELLYGSGAGMEMPLYWYDQNNTELFHVFPEAFGTYCYWSGGHALSNYGVTDFEAAGGYEQQLTVIGKPGAAGHNGSANFAMHNGYIDNSPYSMLETLPALEFYDGKARVIDHIWVTNSTYAINSYVNGTAYSPAASDTDWVKIVATGNHADGSTSTAEFYLLKEGVPVTEWTFWNLSVLGEVVSVEFNLTGSSDNGYGFSQPSYFAYDDVAVRF